MEGNEEEGNRMKKGEVDGQTFGSQKPHEQFDQGVHMQGFAGTIDVHDDLFTQEGFTYTGFLLGNLTQNEAYEENNTQVGTQRSTTKTDNDMQPSHNDKGNNELASSAKTCAWFSAPTQSNAYSSSKTTEIGASSSCTRYGESNENDYQLFSDLVHKNVETKQDYSSTFQGHDEDDPWNISMFNDIQLDQVCVGGAINEEQQTNETNATHDSQAKIRSVAYHETSTISDMVQSETQNDLSADQRNVINEEDIENFLANEKLAAEGHEKSTNESDSEFKPEIGMQFETRDEVQKFFNLYAFTVGFSVSCVSSYRTVSKRRNNEVIRFTMKCNKYGKNSEEENEQIVAQRQSTVIAKTDCKVELVASEKDGVWRITSLNLLHNHELCPQSRFFRSHIYMSDGEKEMIKTMKYCNMPTRDMVAILAFIRGGMAQLPYNKRKVSNYSTSINREMPNNDMMEVLDWFSKKKNENPGFYHSLELDECNKVRSVFWSDARARLHYELCGDCISFDTTFLTNKYNLPFAPFVGVSPHGNTYLFGCAFIVNESAKTFKWLFHEFLVAMGGKPPKSIITDQCKGMEKAIKDVFPNAIHRCCLFHVKKIIDDKGGTCFRANEGLYEELQDIIDKSLTVHEFETLWHAMINEHNVGHVKIFQDVWKSREKWVPVFFKNKFFPFIQTTARSEGTNALFKRGVGAQFSMTSFLREYQRIMDTIHAKEDECDHNATNKKVGETKFLTKYYIERQAHELYNISIFRKFQKILNDVTRLQLREEEKGRKYWVFQAKNYSIKEHGTRNYLVQVDEKNQDYSCICCKFDKDGLLCSHILKVMLQLEVDEIPEKYIIDRWRKKEKKIFNHITPPLNEDSTVLRFNVLSRMLGHTASNGSKNKRKYEYLLQEVPRLEAEMAKMDMENEEVSTMGQSRNVRTVVNMDPEDENGARIKLLNPDVADTKGRPRLLTIKEQLKQKRFYNCSHCGSTEHTKKKCQSLHLVFDLPKRKRNRKKLDKGTKAMVQGALTKKIVVTKATEAQPQMLETNASTSLTTGR